MWGAEHLHGDETSWGGLAMDDEPNFCVGCYEPSEDTELVWLEPYCEACRLNMTCTRCSEYCESVDRMQGQSVCETCLETK